MANLEEKPVVNIPPSEEDTRDSEDTESLDVRNRRSEISSTVVGEIIFMFARSDSFCRAPKGRKWAVLVPSLASLLSAIATTLIARQCQVRLGLQENSSDGRYRCNEFFVLLYVCFFHGGAQKSLRQKNWL